MEDNGKDTKNLAIKPQFLTSDYLLLKQPLYKLILIE